MARWSDYFAALAQQARHMTALPSAQGPSAAAAEQPLPGSDDGLAEPPVAATTLLRELGPGLEVALGDLQSLTSGWCFDGQPVVVFDVDVAACDDSQVRQQFRQRIHLGPCCGALENPQQSVWISSDFDFILHNQSSRLLCPHCLSHQNIGGYRLLTTAEKKRFADEFRFRDYVTSHSDEFFQRPLQTQPELAWWWRSGARLSPLTVCEATQPCSYCDWQPAGGQRWMVQQAGDNGLASDCCLLCAERHGEAAVVAPAALMLQAAEARYQYWCDLAGTVPAALSWHQIEQLLPLEWGMALQALARHVPPPQVFWRMVGYQGQAVLAWPQFRRGIVSHPDDISQLPGDWDFRTLEGVLNSL